MHKRLTQIGTSWGLILPKTLIELYGDVKIIIAVYVHINIVVI